MTKLIGTKRRKNCVTYDGSFYLMLWPDIARVGSIASDFIRGISVAQLIGVVDIDNRNVRRKKNEHLI